MTTDNGSPPEAMTAENGSPEVMTTENGSDKEQKVSSEPPPRPLPPPPSPEDKVIGFYSDKPGHYYREFSNFWQHAEAFEFVLPKFAQCSDGPKSFPCFYTEKAIMVTKASLFGDSEIARKIIEAGTPGECKQLGRQCKFDQALWDEHVAAVAYDVCKQKFVADAHCKEVLLSTGNKTLAEASPYDKIWGIGLAVGDPRVQDKAEWDGQNLLGTALMRVRAYLKLVKKPKWHKVAKIRPDSKGLNLMLKCVSCSKVDGAVDSWEAVCGDDTGVVTFSLRNQDHADICKPGASLRVQNAKVIMVKNFIRVTVDKWAVMKVADKDSDFDAKTETDISATEYEKTGA